MDKETKNRADSSSPENVVAVTNDGHGLGIKLIDFAMLTVCRRDGRPIITIDNDGALAYGGGYKPNEAAELFWSGVEALSRRAAGISRHAAGEPGLTILRDEALRIAVEHGFTDATVGEDLMLMVTEIAEAMEDHRAGKAPADVWYERKLKDYPTPGPGMLGVTIDPPIGAANAVVIEETMQDPIATTLSLAKPCGIPSELADVLIRVLHFCGKHKIDIARAVSEKMQYNASRPYRHGGKTV